MTLTAGLTWPSIARTPRAPLASAVARPIFGRAIRLLPVTARYPDGVAIRGRHATDGSPVFELVRPSAFFARLGQGHHDRLRRGVHGRGLEGRRRAPTWPTC